MCITTFPPWTRQFASQQRLRCVWSLKQPMLGGSWQQRNLGSWSKHVCSSVSLPSRPNRNHSNAMRSGNENCEFIKIYCPNRDTNFLSQHLNFNMDCGSLLEQNHARSRQESRGIFHQPRFPWSTGKGISHANSCGGANLARRLGNWLSKYCIWLPAFDLVHLAMNLSPLFWWDGFGISTVWTWCDTHETGMYNIA